MLHVKPKPLVSHYLQVPIAQEEHVILHHGQHRCCRLCILLAFMGIVILQLGTSHAEATRGFSRDLNTMACGENARALWKLSALLIGVNRGGSEYQMNDHLLNNINTLDGMRPEVQPVGPQDIRHWH